MNKFLIYFLSSIIIFLSLVIALRFFTFSEAGNTTIKTYLQTSLKEEFSMPVKVYNFSLDEEQMKFSVNINDTMYLDVITEYNMLTQYFAGIYYLRADNFEHNGVRLRDANVSGRFKGRRGNMQIQGQGTLLDVNLVYRFHLKNLEFKHFEAKLKGLDSAEVFAMLGEEAFFKGKVDVDIHLPKLGQDEAKGSGNIFLHHALFDTKLIQEKYDITLPTESYVSGKLEMNLEGTKLHFFSTSQSNLFNLTVNNAFINLDEKYLSASYLFDIKKLELFTKNTLAGVFKVEGNTLIDEKKYKILGHSSSLGGLLGFEISDKPSLKLQNIHLDKLLYALKERPYVKGLVTAHFNYLEDVKTGNYALDISKGQFLSDRIDKDLGYQLPSINTFTANTHGLLSKGLLSLQAKLNSSIGDIVLKDASYDIYQKNMQSTYSIFLPNMGLVLRHNKAVKRGYISAEGEATLGKDMLIQGKAKGLGGTVDFMYDKNKAKLQASEVFVEKILSLASVSRYVTGKVKTELILDDMNSLNGNFSFTSDALRTQPRMIEKLIGKKIAIEMSLKSEGEMRDGNISVSTSLEGKIANLYMDKMQINKEQKRLITPYILDIPELKNAYALTGKNLYGPMKFIGNIAYDEILKIDGSTESLGGEIIYQRLDKNLTSQINKVSLENILLLLGYDTLVAGEVSGEVDYHLKEKIGDVNISIKNFHLNTSDTTDKLKLLIGKDPSRIIYTETRLMGNIDEDMTYYHFHAKGSHSSIEIQEGVLDRNTDIHTGIFTFIYEAYEVRGTITGSIAHPKLSLDFSAIMDNPMGKKIQKKINKTLGEDMGKVVGGFLKGLKL